MYRIKSVIFAFLLIFVMLFCGCNDSTPESSLSTITSANSYPQVYKTVLENYKLIVEFRISDDFEVRYNNKEFPNISEDLKSQIYNKNTEVLKNHWWNMIADMTDYIENPSIDSFGYILKDVNSDGSNELFWVDEKYNILAVFTANNEKVELVDAFWPRHNVIITEKNEFLIRSSGGADYTQYKIMTLGDNADLKTIFEFGTNGHDNNSVLFYEVKNGKNISISQKCFNELQAQYPFVISNQWLKLQINSIASIKR